MGFDKLICLWWQYYWFTWSQKDPKTQLWLWICFSSTQLIPHDWVSESLEAKSVMKVYCWQAGSTAFHLRPDGRMSSFFWNVLFSGPGINVYFWLLKVTERWCLPTVTLKLHHYRVKRNVLVKKIFYSLETPTIYSRMTVSEWCLNYIAYINTSPSI